MESSPVVNLNQQSETNNFYPTESLTLGKLAEALSKAQGEMDHAAKDKKNPFFKSSYADLSSVWDACRECLSKNGLAVTQSFGLVKDKLLLKSRLIHSSGEWLSSEIIIQTLKNDPQSIGTAITYFRRFALAALVGVSPKEETNEKSVDDSDDDGNRASGKEVSASEKELSDVSKILSQAPADPSVHRKPSEKQLTRLNAILHKNSIQHKSARDYIRKKWGIPASELNLSQYNELCELVESGDKLD